MAFMDFFLNEPKFSVRYTESLSVGLLLAPETKLCVAPNVTEGDEMMNSIGSGMLLFDQALPNKCLYS